MQVAVVRRFTSAYAQGLVIVIKAEVALCTLATPAQSTLGTGHLGGRGRIFRPAVGLPLAVQQVEVTGGLNGARQGQGDYQKNHQREKP